MLNRAIKRLQKSTKLLATPSRSASRFTRSRHPPTKHVASSSKSIHPPSPPLPAETTNPSTATEQPPSPPPSPESTELSILGPPISRIPVQVPHDSQGVLDLAKGEWSIKVKELLSQPAIVVARQIEFMNIFLGFEQANRYQLLSPEGNLLGYLLEEEVGITGTLKRQFLRTHRPFRATVLSPEGNVLLNIHRPFTFINSRIYVSTPSSDVSATAQEAKREMEQVEQSGNVENQDQQIVIGEAAQVWNLIRRKYETFVKRDGEMVQFGDIDSGFMAWDFSVRDEQGKVIASINRNFTGFARELFADVGQYVIRFEGVVDELNPQLEAPQPAGALPSPTSDSTNKTESTSLTPSTTEPSSSSGSTSLVPSRSETPSIPLDHRATLLATAVSIDFDFFSRHSGAGGMGMGGFMPLPIPMGGFGGGGGAAGEAGEAAEGAGGLGGEVAGIEREARQGEIGSGTPYGDDGRSLPSSEDVEADREGRWPNRDDELGSSGGGWGQEEEVMQDPWAQEPSQEDEGGTWGWNDLFDGDD